MVYANLQPVTAGLVEPAATRACAVLTANGFALVGQTSAAAFAATAVSLAIAGIAYAGHKAADYYKQHHSLKGFYSEMLHGSIEQASTIETGNETQTPSFSTDLAAKIAARKQPARPTIASQSTPTNVL